MAHALLHSNRCFCGARVPITTGPRERRLDRAEIARLLLIPAAYSFQLRRAAVYSSQAIMLQCCDNALSSLTHSTISNRTPFWRMLPRVMGAGACIA